MSVYSYDTVPSNHTLPVHKEDDYSFHSFILKYALYIYTGFIVLTVLLTFLRSILFVIVCMISSINLHNQMFHCLLQAYMRFFDTNPSGRILNRFSKDMGTMDEIIPKTMLEAIQVCIF